MKILAAKQVGIIYYYTDNIYSLINIIREQMIYPSTDIRNHKEYHYASFSRDATIQPRRKPYKWKYGVVIDGNKLSNRYSINPISDTYSRIVKGNMKVAYISLYSDNSAKLSIAGRGTFDLPVNLYHKLKSAILGMPQEELDELGFYSEGRSIRPHLGKYRNEKYGFKAKHGGLRLSTKLPESTISSILKSDTFNEREERIDLSSLVSVNISGCILGVYLPEDFVNSEQVRDIEAMDELKSVLRRATNKIDITVYR